MAANTPKTMSSRLMTMKFMQRSAAKSVASSPSTPNGPPSKKARLSNGRSAPGTPGTPDHEILQSALAAEEKQRQDALEKAAQHSGETRWVLSFKDPLEGKRSDAMNVRQAGFSEIDASDDSEEEEEAKPTKMQFGGGVKKKIEKPVTFVSKEDDSDGETESSSDELDSDDPTAALIRETKRDLKAERREARMAQESEANDTPKHAPQPIDEDADLRGLHSLSGGGGTAGRGPRDMSQVECFGCGRRGHERRNCPNQHEQRGNAGRGRGNRRR